MFRTSFYSLVALLCLPAALALSQDDMMTDSPGEMPQASAEEMPPCPNAPTWFGYYRHRVGHWRCYTPQERRSFPVCYGGYPRYMGAFHASYFRNYPVNNSGLNNRRYGYGPGWAW